MGTDAMAASVAASGWPSSGARDRLMRAAQPREKLRVRPGWIAHSGLLVFLLAYPFAATPFFTYQIGGQALVLGLVALSLTFLAGYGGMLSLAQMTVAGIAGYCVAIFGVSGTPEISLGWPWPLVLVIAVVVAVACGTLIGWLSVRTEGIYTIMITLAIGVAFFYLAQQNYAVFNGFRSISWRCSGPWRAMASCAISRVRRSAWRYRGCATIRAAWPPSASMSPRTASPPMPSRA
jgi:branched-chain amino acid transport system permease protein